MLQLPAGSVFLAAAAYHGPLALPGPPLLGPPGTWAGPPAPPGRPEGAAGCPAAMPAPASAQAAAGQASRRTDAPARCPAGPPGQFAGPAATITSCLSKLKQEDPERVIVVRRVNTLGHATEEALTLHFSAFGRVSKVLATRSRVAIRPGKSRIRAGGIAYVVMEDARSVEGILQAGPQQTVLSRSILVEPYADLGRESADAASAKSTSTSAGSANLDPWRLGNQEGPQFPEELWGS